MKTSFAVRLSLRFMFILTTAVILLSISFLYFLRSLVHNSQTNEMRKAEAVLFEEITICCFDEEEIALDTTVLPYFRTFIAYYSDTGDVIATNDPFLPLLEDTHGKAIHHFEKDFFFDGDLDIFYYAASHKFKGRPVVVAVAENIENDFFSKVFTRLPFALLLLSIPVLIISFLFSLFVTKRTIKPVLKITRAAQNMTTENLQGQLPLSGLGDEIDELSNTFNELFDRIRADFERERQFSSDVSHELNTPLTVITGQTNLLLRWGKDNPEQLEKSLNAIKNESKSMHAIIDNLLQISRVESGRIKPHICNVDVNELFERIKHEFSAIAPEAKIQIECNIPSVIKTDPEMLHQILTVFVSNSVKFAGTECTVLLKADISEDGSVQLFESDDGPGISEEALPHIFDRFFRADEAHTRSAGGSGLGLAIAKTLAEALGAEIQAGNTEPHGAFFTITFA